MRKPTKAVSECEEFFLRVVEAHIMAAAMDIFEMTSTDDEPSNKVHFPQGSDDLSPDERRKVLIMTTGELVDKIVDITPYSADECASDSNSKGKKTGRQKKSRKHTKKSRSEGKKDKNVDCVVEYASEVVTLGLLLIEFNDAIREGDGTRICRCWKFFLPLFKATNRKNYAIEAFVMLAQLNFTFTPRMAAQLKWCRTINTHGRPGKNISCDLHMEHLNRICKGSMAALGSNVTENSVLRVGKCLGKTCEIIDAFDKENDIPQLSGKHACKTENLDRNKILEQLLDIKVFKHIHKRKHSTFKNFMCNPSKRLKRSQLIDWMKEHLLKLV